MERFTEDEIALGFDEGRGEEDVVAESAEEGVEFWGGGFWKRRDSIW